MNSMAGEFWGKREGEGDRELVGDRRLEEEAVAAAGSGIDDERRPGEGWGTGMGGRSE